MSKAADLIAARIRAEQEAPGLDGPKSNIPDTSQMEKERQALEQMETNVVDNDVAIEAQTKTPPMPAVKPPQAPPKAPEDTQVQEVEQAPPDPIELLSSMPNGPTKEQLQQMKLDWPEVFFLPLRDEEVYIYRYLNNLEWRTQLLTQERLVENQDALKDAVIQRCVLWPRLSPQEWATRQAGLKDLLYEVVMKSSYFIEPEQAMALVMRL
ncbi:MAG: hypothetical protein ACXABY_08030 [Candidatus Thorarchaeota archaeon]|jgi:hypothetical protein